MKFTQPNAKIFIPDSLEAKTALKRTTHLVVGAHHDDLEIMGIDGILQCFQQKDKWFSGVVVTDGRGSARSGPYANYTDEEMMLVRIQEQEKAAVIGEYGSQIFLDYPSSAVKDGQNQAPVKDIENIIRMASPKIMYTHNLADKHLTHIGVVVKTIQAIRNLPEKERPQKLYGCEVWRDLDWVLDTEKVIFDCSERPNLQEALLGVYDSQISGGKRYDLATMGRRIANATYFASHDVDESTGMTVALDLTPLIKDPSLDLNQFVQAYICRFAQNVTELINTVM
ncbi:MAG: PIG-L family deacetylase [Anaerolineaceae bacterium]|nr:PIG-L family deacetylase [Anaerolineaceae bacterium]